MHYVADIPDLYIVYEILYGYFGFWFKNFEFVNKEKNSFE